MPLQQDSPLLVVDSHGDVLIPCIVFAAMRLFALPMSGAVAMTSGNVEIVSLIATSVVETRSAVKGVSTAVAENSTAVAFMAADFMVAAATEVGATKQAW